MSDRILAEGSYAGQGDASRERSGFWRRFAAVFVDGVILGTAGGLVGKAFGQDVFAYEDGTISYAIDGAAAAWLLAINLAYYIVLEGGSAGATIGKRVMGIRIVDVTSGDRIGFGSAALRWVGRFVSLVPLLLGYFWMLWDDQKQTWHDKFAHAVVVRRSGEG